MYACCSTAVGVTSFTTSRVLNWRHLAKYWCRHLVAQLGSCGSKLNVESVDVLGMARDIAVDSRRKHHVICSVISLYGTRWAGRLQLSICMLLIIVGAAGQKSHSHRVHGLGLALSLVWCKFMGVPVYGALTLHVDDLDRCR